MLSAVYSGKDIFLMDDPRTAIVNNLLLDKCRIEFSDSPIVLLCGGPVGTKEHPDDPDPPLKSFRDAIYRKHTEYETFMPEEINTWQNDAIYKNLMSFEKDLAGICTLVVIALESPGAIAELGAFSQLDDLSEKLVVIRSHENSTAPSFINLGIIRYIKENDASSVKTYPWELSNPAGIQGDAVDDAVSDIAGHLVKANQSQVFRNKNNSHIIVLICELVRIFVALKESEIFDYLKTLAIDIKRDDLRSKLYLLAEFRIIKKEEYSDADFYVYGKSHYHKLRLNFPKGFNIDSVRIQAECIEYYNKTTQHRHRVRVISKLNMGGDK